MRAGSIRTAAGAAILLATGGVAEGATMTVTEKFNTTANDVPFPVTMEGFDPALGTLTKVTWEFEADATITLSPPANYDSDGVPQEYAFTTVVQQDVTSTAGGEFGSEGEWFKLATHTTGAGEPVNLVHDFDVTATFDSAEQSGAVPTAFGYTSGPTLISGGFDTFTTSAFVQKVSIDISAGAGSLNPVPVSSVTMPGSISTTYQYTAVPEPGSLTMLAVLGGSSMIRTRRRSIG
jgi:hypothetical protein